MLFKQEMMNQVDRISEGVNVFRGSQRSCSIKKLFLKTSQYSQKNTCVGVSFW